MDNIIESICDFISGLISVVLIGGTVTIFAGEIRLAALKKAAQGSTKLSSFTSKMTKTKLPLGH